MPWKATKPVDLKIEFIARLRAGERMTDLCREYGISRKTGHKLANRVERFGGMAWRNGREHRNTSRTGRRPRWCSSSWRRGVDTRAGDPRS